MLDSLRRERKSALSGMISPAFIDSAVDFFKTYVDGTHHGKEKNILFVELAKKDL